MSDNLDIGNRMKRYEAAFSPLLPRRLPVVIRIDGRAFHTITRKRFGRAWSQEFVDQMANTAKVCMADMQGCSFAYSQSDEVSFLLTDYATINTGAWFDYEVSKLISISASLASAEFSRIYGRNVCFDSRCFVLPQDDVCNYFLWRQIDAQRNSVMMAAREHFSTNELFQRTCADAKVMLADKGIIFDDYPTVRKRGFCITDGQTDFDIPVFSEDREYVENYVFVRKD